MNEKQIEKLKEYAAKSELDKLLPFFDVLEDIRDILKEKEMPKMEMPHMPETMKVEMEGVSVMTLKGDKGDKGDKPTEEEVVKLIKPLIPKPIPGPKGDRGDDSRVPGPKGDKGDRGDRGEPGKDADEEKIVEKIEQDLPKLGERIRDGLELLEGEDRLDKKAIKGLDEELKAIRELPRGGVPRRVFIPYRTDLSSSCDGANKTFFLDRAPLDEGTIMVYGTDFPVILRPTIDFTIANKILTLTESVPAPSSGATLICTYFA